MAKIIKLKTLPKSEPLPTPTEFLDLVGKSDIPAPTLINTRVALKRLGIVLRFDVFKARALAGDTPLTTDDGQISDEAITALRVMIRDQFGFDPGKNNTWDAVTLACRENSFHPVRDYLDSCLERREPWDETGAIDSMLVKYFGAPDTPFVRAVSRIVMIAAVRRIYEPGTKFDYMTVLESPEGFNKSSGLAALCGEQWFSDQTIIGLDDKALQETLRGRWFVESADLSGMRKADVEKVKAQLSRFEDRSRPAYGRAVVDAPRTAIFFGTTNDDIYLRSQTGNRRFFPVPVARIDVAGLHRNRDSLWGEAMAVNLTRESIMLPEPLWRTAAIEQEARTYQDPWQDDIEDALRACAAEPDKFKRTYRRDAARGIERVASAFLLRDVVGVPAERKTAEHGKRIGTIMRRLGWHGPKAIDWGGGVIAKGYERALSEREPWE